MENIAPERTDTSRGFFESPNPFLVELSNLIIFFVISSIISAGIVNPDEKNSSTNPTFSKLFSQFRAATNTSN